MTPQRSTYYDAAFAGQLSTSEQDQIIKLAKRQANKKMVGLIVVCALVVLGLLVGWTTFVFVMELEEFLIDIGIWLLVAPSVIATVLLANHSSRITKRHVMAAMKERSVRPVFCLTCHYDLSLVPSDQCPECGAELAPQTSASITSDSL